MSPGSLFASRDFRLLLAGQTTSQLGTQVSSVALPLLTVLTLQATAFDVGLISAASTLAFALVGLPAGVWLDQLRRRPVLIASDVLRAVVLATIPTAALLGVLTVTQLVVVSLVVGLGRVFFDVGYRSYLPSVIGRDRVLAGNASLEFVRASGQVAGPGLGGALVSVASAANVVVIQAVTFAVSAVTLLAVRTAEPPPAVDPVRPRLGRQIVDGLSFVWHNRLLRATAAASAASNLSFALASAVTILFMSRTLGLSPAAIGLVLAGGSGAVMVGAALTTRIAEDVGSARLIWLSLAVTSPLSVLGVLAQPGWGLILLVVGMVAGELGQIVYAITSVSLRQHLCPDNFLGQVNATMTVLIMGLLPLGAVLGGVLGELVGV
ncbi:MAG TPA: MFS transporter, partial [Propionibacteriaceae bacterium]|nr:MFS transporter [Propionibacteriaceae bacterium]